MNGRLMVVLLALLPLAAQAQQGAEAGKQQAATEQTEQREGAEQEQRAPGNVQARAPGQDDNTDADDYQASEDISEDLSVSYPVDI